MGTRNIILLTTCQLISATGSITVVTLGGIIGSRLTDNQALATLPVSIMVVSVASTTIPATMLMRAIGRRRSFSLASLSAVAAVLLATYAIEISSFAWFVAAGWLFGMNTAFTQQYRYAAAESVEQRFVPRAISIVLLGAIGGAILGPELLRLGTRFVPEIEFAGALLGLAVLYVIQSALFFLLEPLQGEEQDPHEARGRALAEIVRQPLFVVAVLGGMTAYGAMTLIMTATPISMHIIDEFSVEQTAHVIRSHVIGMYLPSLFTGFLIERLGLVRLMVIGTIAMIAACFIGLQGHAMMHYTFALVLLGVGWNFLYVGGTLMLTLTYAMSERFKAQALNEFAVFGTSATASLLAGTTMHLHGWYALVLVPLPLLLLILVGLYAVRGDSRLRRLAPA